MTITKVTASSSTEYMFRGVSLSWDLSHVSLTIRLGLQVLGKEDHRGDSQHFVSIIYAIDDLLLLMVTLI